MAKQADGKQPTPDALLKSLIERFGPDDQKLIRSLRAALRKRLPTANELLYDYKKFFVISYSPTERGAEGIAALAARSDGMRLYLMPGPRLPDKKKLLKGSGKEARFMQLESAKQLKDPDVEALIAAAIELSKIPLPKTGKGRLLARTAGEK